MNIEEAAEMKNKASQCIENIINELEVRTGMVCSELFVLTDEENNKTKVDMYLRLKIDTEIENENNN